LRFYDTRTWKMIATAPVSRLGYDVVISPDGKTLAASCDDGTVTVYDLAVLGL
jgi:hypothetical protein